MTAQASGERATGDQRAEIAAPAPWPTPWRIDRDWPAQSRARIIDADGKQVIAGMNHAKAEFIVAAVNRDDDLSELLTALKMARECIGYCRKAHKDAQSGEGFPVETLIDAIIAKAEGL